MLRKVEAVNIRVTIIFFEKAILKLFIMTLYITEWETPHAKERENLWRENFEAISKESNIYYFIVFNFTSSSYKSSIVHIL